MIKRMFFTIASMMIISTMFFIGCSTSNNNNYKPEKQLPKYLFNSKGQYICHIYNDYLYNKQNNRAIAYYDEEINIFISLTGKYFGEIKDEDLLLYNTNSQYINTIFDAKPLPPMAPTQPTPSTHKTPNTQPSNWIDVIL